MPTWPWCPTPAPRATSAAGTPWPSSPPLMPKATTAWARATFTRRATPSCTRPTAPWSRSAPKTCSSSTRPTPCSWPTATAPNRSKTWWPSWRASSAPRPSADSSIVPSTAVTLPAAAARALRGPCCSEQVMHISMVGPGESTSRATAQTRKAVTRPCRMDFFAVMAPASLPQARSATRSPMMPDGRSVRTTISTMNAKMSW